MTHTVDSLMALHDKAASALVDERHDDCTESEERVVERIDAVIETRAALHAALTEALAPQAAQPLTDEQIDDLTGAAFDDHAWRGTTVLNREVARAVERAHKIGCAE